MIITAGGGDIPSGLRMRYRAKVILTFFFSPHRGPDPDWGGLYLLFVLGGGKLPFFQWEFPPHPVYITNERDLDGGEHCGRVIS